MKQIINDNDIFNLINVTKNTDKYKIREIFDKILELNGLNPEETAYLLNLEDKEQIDELLNIAYKIKNEIYGNRLVLFAPLYVSNFCSNNCLYCGFRVENKELDRVRLNLDEITQETIAILEQGHKRILLLMGEDNNYFKNDYLINVINTIYAAKDSKGSSIRRINLEIAPLKDEEFKLLSKVEIGTYTVFQETYHRETYNQMHTFGHKSDFDFRLETMDRALSNGMKDVGIGTLFGLYDYKFEVIAMLMHAQHLDKEYGVGPHTISVPRIKPASNAPASLNIPHSINDDDFKKLVAIIRCSVPYTGMIISTRETAELRNELFKLGISQTSAGSKTNPGGYKQALNQVFDGQFSLNDCRSSGEVIADVIRQGFLPSFCTACYRLGRVGADFMDLAKPGLIKLHCQPNGITTLMEYLELYADEETKNAGMKLIEKEMLDIPNVKVQQKTKEYINRIAKGECDLYFLNSNYISIFF